MPAVYDAFISYSHAKDKPIAAALQAVMQRLGKPWHKRRALRIFRDDTSLAATPELWPSIQQALEQSRYLIVLASPQFARSRWCGLEVEYWLKHRSIDTLLIGLTEGELSWDEAAHDFVWRGDPTLSAALEGRFAHEPKWIDLRPWRDHPNAGDAKFIDAGADLAAAVHGMPKEDLLSQEVRQQKRALALAWSAAAVLLALAGAVGWQWWEAEGAKRAALAAEKVATEQRDIAQTQRDRAERAQGVAETERGRAEQAQRVAETERDRAERNLAIARRAADDLVFSIAQALRNVQGMRVEAIRQILEAAQAVMDELVRRAPDDSRLQGSRVAMLTEFAVTYLTAGDIERARQAAEEALAVSRKFIALFPTDERWQVGLAVSLERLGDVNLAAGDTERALALFEEAAAFRRKMVEAKPDDVALQGELSTALVRVADVRLARSDRAGALTAYEEALALIRKVVAADAANAEWPRVLMAALSRIGNIRLAVGERAAALAAYEEALAIARKLSASDVLNTAWRRDVHVLLINVGDAHLANGNRPDALTAYEEALAIMRALSRTDPGHVEWQFDVAMCLYKVSTASGPMRARAALREALSIVEALEIAGKLTANQRTWLRTLRDAVAALPSEGLSGPARLQ